MVDSFSSSQPTQISNGRMINSGRNRFIKTILHPASPKCLQTKNPMSVGLVCHFRYLTFFTIIPSKYLEQMQSQAGCLIPTLISVKYPTVKPTATPITNLRNQWISLIFITKSTHHPTNKKPHECGVHFNIF